MALAHLNFYSQVIGVETEMNVILPQKKSSPGQEEDKRQLPERFPVLYLLHGLTDDHTAWARKSSVERYLTEKGIAAVMPAVHRSFYTDMIHGYDYWTFISEEVPEIATRYFPLRQEREMNFVAGLSMGGYGAFKLALSRPEKFAAAASLSGALDIVREIEEEKDLEREFKLVFGSRKRLKGSNNDLMALLEKAASGEEKLPALYQCCGTEDFLYEDNLCFRQQAKELGISLNFEDGPGDHNWDYWDKKIRDVLDWLPL